MPAMVFSIFNFHVVAPVLDASKVAGVPVSMQDFERCVLALIAPSEEWECETFRGFRVDPVVSRGCGK